MFMLFAAVSYSDGFRLIVKTHKSAHWEYITMHLNAYEVNFSDIENNGDIVNNWYTPIYPDTGQTDEAR